MVGFPCERHRIPDPPGSLTIPEQATYEPSEYWTARVARAGKAAVVGHREMPLAYNRIAYRCRLRAFEAAVGSCPSWPEVSAFVAGFGPGFYLDYLHSQGVGEVWGVDLTEAAVEHASERFPGYRLFQHDITEPLEVEEPGSFELVTAIDVLFHILEDKGWRMALEQLGSLLRPGGVLVLTDKFPSEGTRETSPTVRWRSMALYEEVLAGQGLSPVRTIPVFLWMDEPVTFGAHPWLGVLSRLQWGALKAAARALQPWPRMRAALFRAVASLQYPIERASLALLTRTPNLEMLVARKD